MTGLFGWWPDSGLPAPDVTRAMAAALRVEPTQTAAFDQVGPVSVGATAYAAETPRTAPWRVESSDGVCTLWVAGEVFATRAPLRPLENPSFAQWAPLLLHALRDRGPEALVALDGDFQLAFWNGRTRTLLVACDRFGSQPLYWMRTPDGFAFAFGVRGVLVAPGATSAPDPEAIREAVTFGGYRLGDRTNIRDVSMLSLASALVVRDRRQVTQRYWWWNQIPLIETKDLDGAAERALGLWKASIRRRLKGSARPGQTLSGGRDSRAILAEATSTPRHWTAMTYGVGGCDDARYGGRAARTAGADWIFLPLYDSSSVTWLERRTGHVQHTDGLIDAVDLMHLEHQPTLTTAVDCLLSGYLGDVVAGNTHTAVDSLESALRMMPYTGASIALSWGDAVDRLRAATSWRPGDGAPRLMLWEHKFRQATNRPQHALSSWVRVRRPFLDVSFLEHALGSSDELRTRLYDRWLQLGYATLFRIPVQKTGARAGAGVAGLTLARGVRLIRRASRRAAVTLGRTPPPWSRTFTADEREFGRAEIRASIEDTILRRDCLCCDIWRRSDVARLVQRWLARGEGASQVVASLYTWEAYHRDLADHLSQAKRAAAA